MKLYCYPKCSTCRAAAKFLDARGIAYTYIDIKETPPSAQTLKKYWKQSGLDLKRFFNTSGNSYRALGLKESFAREPESNLLKLLSQDGMLIKRPLLVSEDFVLLGFREEEWLDKLPASR